MLRRKSIINRRFFVLTRGSIGNRRREEQSKDAESTRSWELKGYLVLLARTDIEGAGILQAIGLVANNYYMQSGNVDICSCNLTLLERKQAVAALPTDAAAKICQDGSKTYKMKQKCRK